ncbi:MAG TPA: mannose-6-phosphate isomerase, class I [Glaciihabitans sp.]|jgi:mannose-6-phosphate isomerase|nr:mannose-6-phosphate isomerase, class I [Glaciihabitans sp.]
MFVGITNTPRDYPWGSTTAIAELLGYTPTGTPEAELWLGAHPGSPAVIIDPSRTSGASTLAEWIAADPATALGAGDPATSGAPDSTGSSASTGPRLPFLMKVLAAAAPLSLQAHPTIQQAQEGFARENAAGIALDAPFRNYKDAYPKPELMLALSDTFEALCGFRSADLIRGSLAQLIAAAPVASAPFTAFSVSDGSIAIQSLRDRLDSDAALPATFEWLLTRGEGVDALIEAVVDVSTVSAEQLDGPEFATVRDLAEQYPGDPGIVISLLVNRVSLRRGDVLYLPAGNIHAYLHGLGIEVMASSDNVLRGGLTTKHVDVPELLSVLDFTPVPVPYLPPTELAAGVRLFTPDVPDFQLLHVEGADREVDFALHGPAIVLCISGAFRVDGSGVAAGDAGSGAGSGADGSSVLLGRADTIYVTPNEGRLTISGSGELVVATVNR